MGVYIRGMEMPKSCWSCDMPLGTVKCPVQTEEEAMRYCSCRHKDCPLVPIPPHGDLIDVDALEQDAQKRLLICDKNDNQFQKPYEIMRAIALAPTIIPAEEVET